MIKSGFRFHHPSIQILLDSKVDFYIPLLGGFYF